ncbi:MAG: PQQ-binding-like beta-propeller repeat protein [Akkermansiaceae bacterium]
MKFCLLLALSLSAQALDWPQWRGPTGDNKSASSVKPVTEWSTEKNVLWKTKIPGRGHSSPIITGKRIYLTTADLEKATQSLIALDRTSGTVLWEKVIHKGGLAKEVHRENSHASSTPQWDGTHILTTFQNNDKIKISAVTPAGDIAWSKSVSDYLPSFHFGYGSTPVLHKGLFIISIGTDKNGSLIAIDTKTGEQKWRTPRAIHDNWSTPIVAKLAGKDQLLISGTGEIQSYDPMTGKKNWAGPLVPLSTCGTVAWTDEAVYASGGYPGNETVGIKADGSGEVLWRNKERCYEQSLFSHAGHIYAVTDQGVGFCWRATDGKEMWKERLGRGGVMASPTFANEMIFSTIKTGVTIVYKATHEGFQKISENKLGDDTYATPVILDDGIFIRPGFIEEGERQEFLYKLGKQEK